MREYAQYSPPSESSATVGRASRVPAKLEYSTARENSAFGQFIDYQ